MKQYLEIGPNLEKAIKETIQGCNVASKTHYVDPGLERRQ